MKKHNYLKRNHVSRTFTCTDYRTIYNYPSPTLTSEVVVGIISFGGGVYGDIDSDGYLTNSDVHQYLNDLNLSIPTIIVKTIMDGQLDVSDDSGTIENTMDIEMIAGCCPSTHLTIILYVASQNVSFYDAFNYMLTVPVNEKLPTVISCSWGMTEIFVSDLFETNELFKSARLRGINICTATGDYGSTNGIDYKNQNFCDFPSSSPNVIACGGTTLICPNYKYDNETKEYTWSNGGGGISRYFKKSEYQLIQKIYRNTPDIAMNADPYTGVSVLINGEYITVGGTSIVAPAFAAYIACCNLNDRFIIPYIYKFSNTFHDIIKGNNGGYKASFGFDRCTGVGSLNGIRFYNSIINGAIKILNNKIIIGKEKYAEYDGTHSIVSYTLSNTRAYIKKNNGNVFKIIGVNPGTVQFTITLDNGIQLSKTFIIVKRYYIKMAMNHSIKLTNWTIPRNAFVSHINSIIKPIKKGQIIISKPYQELMIQII